MKLHTGTHCCDCCKKTFDWQYLDDGYRPWKRPYIAITSEANYISGITILYAKKDFNDKTAVFTGYCPNCGSPVCFDCSEDILQELLT